MDIFWFNLPREEGDPEGAGAVFRCGRGRILVLMDHSEHWQVGYIIPLGEHQGYLNLKGYKEFDPDHRPSGWNVWLTYTLSPSDSSATPLPPPGRPYTR